MEHLFLNISVIVFVITFYVFLFTKENKSDSTIVLFIIFFTLSIIINNKVDTDFNEENLNIKTLLSLGMETISIVVIFLCRWSLRNKEKENGK